MIDLAIAVYIIGFLLKLSSALKGIIKEPDKNDGKSLVDVDGYCISWSK